MGAKLAVLIRMARYTMEMAAGHWILDLGVIVKRSEGYYGCIEPGVGGGERKGGMRVRKKKERRRRRGEGRGTVTF